MRTSHPERRTSTLRQFALVMAAVTWFALLVPVGVRAAGQLVTIVDPTTSTKARVDGNGGLRVDGTVKSFPGRAGTLVEGQANFGTKLQPFLGPFSQTQRLAITSLTLTASEGTSAMFVRLWYKALGSGSDCSTANGDLALFWGTWVRPGDTVHMAFPQPFLVDLTAVVGPQAWCLWVQNGGSSGNGWALGIGYTY